VEGPGPPCLTIVLGNLTREKNSYFRRAKSAQFSWLFTLCTKEGASRNPHVDGAVEWFEDDGLGVAQTHGGQGGSDRYLP